MTAVEVLENDSPPSQMMLICDHASNAVPSDFDVTDADRRRLDVHWGWDPGAEPLVRRLAELGDAPAVLSKFSRLLCDPNRRLDQEHLFRTSALGEPIDLNRDLDVAEREDRLDRFYRPYHRAVDRRLTLAVDRNPDIFLLSVHTFTPELDGEVRNLELGVLFDHGQENDARDLADALHGEGFDTALNEPYSGKEGLMYSVKRHGTNHGIRHLELEVRNDLLGSAEDVATLARRVYRAVEKSMLLPTSQLSAAPTGNASAV